MNVRRVGLSAVLSATVCAGIGLLARAQNPEPVYVPGQTSSRMYNTALQKMREGKPVVGGTIESPDPNMYCAMAHAGFDFLWIEMQHSPLTFEDVAHMIRMCPGPATPFIRVPDATESQIQKATDIGALGIIQPTVDTAEKAADTVKWAKYPPMGRRSMGSGQYRTLWGSDYRQTINNNMAVVIMIETPLGVDNAEKIAAVPGVDAIFAASTDLGNFSGLRQGDPGYEKLVTRIHDITLAKGIRLGGPLMWKTREGFSFFQGPSEAGIIAAGSKVILGTGGSGEGGGRGARSGAAPGGN